MMHGVLLAELHKLPLKSDHSDVSLALAILDELSHKTASCRRRAPAAAVVSDCRPEGAAPVWSNFVSSPPSVRDPDPV